MFAELLIATYDDQIDLLRANRHGEGIGLTRYTPGTPTFRDGGVWADSPLAPGRRRVQGVVTNTTDACELKITYRDARQVIDVYRQLLNLVNYANSYWDAEYQEYPVWLIARTQGEAARRYAIIYWAQLSDLPDPYHEPFQGGAAVTLEGISLGIERDQWSDTPPLQATPIPLTNLSHGAPTTDWVYVGNGYNPFAGLTHIYAHCIIGGGTGETDSVNLLEKALPYGVFDSDGSSDGPEIDSAVYFGSDFRFSGLAFHLDAGLFPASGTKALVWEYWNGSSWFDFDAFPEDGINPYRDGTNEFGKLGTTSIFWEIPENWAKNSPRTYPEKYWVRVRIADGFGYTANRPRQTVRQIYSLSNVIYVEAAAGATDGDSDSSLRLRLRTEGTRPSEVTFFGSDPTLPVVIRVGLRSYSRGNNFSPWINLDGNFNVTGLDAGLPGADDRFPFGSGGSLAFNSTVYSPTTDKVLRILTGTLDVDPTEGMVWRARFSRSILNEYYGEYRIFVRAFEDDPFGENEEGVYLRYSAHFMPGDFPGILQGEWTRVGQGGNWDAVDLGRIRIPLTSLVNPTELTREVYLKIYLRADSGRTVYLNDVFLLPIDEWAAEVDVSAFLNQQYDRIVNIDSALNPRRPMRCVVEVDANGNIDVERTGTLLTTGEAILHAGARQRLYFLMSSPRIVSGPVPLEHPSIPGLSVSVKAEAVSHYNYLR